MYNGRLSIFNLSHLSMINIKHRWHKQQRYYEAYVTQDLLGDWVVISSWGQLDGAGACLRKKIVDSEEKAMDALHQIYRLRKKNGYVGVQ